MIFKYYQRHLREIYVTLSPLALLPCTNNAELELKKSKLTRFSMAWCQGMRGDDSIGRNHVNIWSSVALVHSVRQYFHAFQLNPSKLNKMFSEGKGS